MTEPIVITGLGLVLPCGEGAGVAAAAWRERAQAFQTLPTALGGGPGAPAAFDPSGIIPALVNRRLDRATRFAWGAAHQAFTSAGVDPAALGDRLGICVGTMAGGGEATEAFMKPYLEKGPAAASPMLFPNCVAVSISGQLAMAYQIHGPSFTQLGRENSTFAALEQAARWIRLGFVEAMLVIGTDGLFPLLMELLTRARLRSRTGLPEIGARRGFLPGEGAQAFLLETRARATARGGPIRATLAGLASRSALGTEDRAEALAEAADCFSPKAPEAWIAGSNGHPFLDAVEAPLKAAHPRWPAPAYPKLLWGEFCGSGGQLLAAALLDPARRVLVTAPASSGSQYAALIEK